MSTPLVPLDIPDAGPDAEAIVRALQTPHPEGSEPLDGITARPEPGESEPQGPDTDAEKLARAKPGRKRSPISKHRTKPELLAAARELDAENQQLRAQLGERVEGGPDAGPATPAQVLTMVRSSLDATIALGGKLLAAYRGDHWDIPQEEREVLRDAWVPILAEYAPQLGKALPWMGALSTTAMVVLPRLGRDAELAKLKRPASQAAEPLTTSTQGKEAEPDTPAPMPGRHIGGPV